MKIIRKKVFVKSVLVSAVLSGVMASSASLANDTARTVGAESIVFLSSFSNLDKLNSLSGSATGFSGGVMELELDIDVKQARDLQIFIQSKVDFKTITTQVYSITNSGSVNVTAEIPEGLESGQYRWVAIIVPVGGSWKDRVGNKLNWNFDIEPNIETPIDSMSQFHYEDVIKSTETTSVSAFFEASESVDFTLRLLDESSDIYGEYVFTEVIGGNHSFDLAVPEVDSGTYTWEAFITPQGASEFDVIGERQYFEVTVERSAPEVLVGDIDKDGDVDANDIKQFLDMLRSRQTLSNEFDFNGDGRVNTRDLEGLRALCTLSRCAVITNPVPKILEVADLDGDGDVDRYDRAEFSHQLRHDTASMELDLTNDGVVDRCDVVYIKNACNSGKCISE